MAASKWDEWAFTLNESLYSTTARVEAADGPGTGNMAAWNCGLIPSMAPMAAEGARNMTAWLDARRLKAWAIVPAAAPGWKQPAALRAVNSSSASCHPLVLANVVLPAWRCWFQLGSEA